MAVQAVPQTPAPQIPTRSELEAQLTQLVVNRSQLKDQIEQIERQMPSIASMVQLLQAQEEIAKASAEAVTED